MRTATSDGVQAFRDIVIGNMRAEMARRQLSRAKLSSLSGINDSTLGRIMRGEVLPDIGQLLKIADALGVHITVFMRSDVE